MAKDTYIATAGQTAFTVTFVALEASHIKASVDGLANNNFNLNPARTTLTFTSPLAGGEVVIVYRETPIDVGMVDFVPGGVRSVDLDTAFTQLLYLIQEQQEAIDDLELALASQDPV